MAPSTNGVVAYLVQTAVSGGSGLLIFVRHIRRKDDPAGNPRAVVGGQNER